MAALFVYTQRDPITTSNGLNLIKINEGTEQFFFSLKENRLKGTVLHLICSTDTLTV